MNPELHKGAEVHEAGGRTAVLTESEVAQLGLCWHRLSAAPRKPKQQTMGWVTSHLLVVGCDVMQRQRLGLFFCIKTHTVVWAHPVRLDKNEGSAHKCRAARQPFLSADTLASSPQ